MGDTLKENKDVRGKWLGWISNHPLIVLTGFVFTILGLAVSVLSSVQATYQNAPKQFAFLTSSRQLVSTEESGNLDIVILYKSKPVPEVWLTQIDISVYGNKGIRRDDVADNKPFVIRASNAERVLEVLRVESTNPINQFTAVWDDENQQIEIDFAFMDVNDRATIQVIHAGDLEFVPEAYLIGTGNESKAIRQQHRNWG